MWDHERNNSSNGEIKKKEGGWPERSHYWLYTNVGRYGTKRLVERSVFPLQQAFFIKFYLFIPFFAFLVFLWVERSMARFLNHATGFSGKWFTVSMLLRQFLTFYWNYIWGSPCGKGPIRGTGNKKVALKPVQFKWLWERQCIFCCGGFDILKYGDLGQVRYFRNRKKNANFTKKGFWYWFLSFFCSANSLISCF